MRVVFGIILALLLSACSGGVSKEGTVVIAPGSSLTAAARQLEKDGVIESADGFLRYAKLFGDDEPIKPGEYQIKSGMSDGDLLALRDRFAILTPAEFVRKL